MKIYLLWFSKGFLYCSFLFFTLYVKLLYLLRLEMKKLDRFSVKSIAKFWTDQMPFKFVTEIRMSDPIKVHHK